jgi:tetratricopeptide (TPR) repeat protein
MRPTGKPERVQPQIALFFSDVPPSERRYSVRIGDPPIDIAPGEKNYRIADSYTLPADVHLLGVFPHAHYLAKTVRIFSRLPDGKRLELLEIPDWDFAWQDEYTFVTPPLLAKGSTLQMEFTYDNSASNLRNPNRPPVRVRSGIQSTDEMGNVTFQAMPVRREELDLLLTSKYERQLARAPNAEAHYNLANSLARRGQSAQASDHYRQALALDAQFAAAHFNLAGLLIADRQFAAAIPQLEACLEARPDDSAARLALGQALLQVARYDEAVAQYERVLAEQPDDARAHVMLADALRDHGQFDPARIHYEQALRLMPDWPPARTGLTRLVNLRAQAPPLDAARITPQAHTR